MSELYAPLRVAELLVIVVWIAIMVVGALSKLRRMAALEQECREELDRLRLLVDDTALGGIFDPSWDDEDEPTAPRPDREMLDELPF